MVNVHVDVSKLIPEIVCVCVCVYICVDALERSEHKSIGDDVS